MRNQIEEEGLLLELTYYGKIRVSNYDRESMGCIYGFIIFVILAFLMSSWNNNDKFSKPPYSFTFVIIFLIGKIIWNVFKAFYDRKNVLYLTKESITICNYKDKVLHKWMLANVYWFSQRKYETEDGTVNHLIIVDKDKEEFIDLAKLNDKQISKFLKQIVLLNFEIRNINT